MSRYRNVVFVESFVFAPFVFPLGMMLHLFPETMLPLIQICLICTKEYQVVGIDDIAGSKLF